MLSRLASINEKENISRFSINFLIVQSDICKDTNDFVETNPCAPVNAEGTLAPQVLISSSNPEMTFNDFEISFDASGRGLSS